MPVAGPDKCPECGHEPLMPLDSGVCPECGFEYDAPTRIWRPRRPWRIYILFANTLIFSPWLFKFFEITLLHHQWPNTSVSLGAAMSGVSLIWALPRLRVLLSDGHRYAAVTPRGVEARTPRNRHVVPWSELAEVSVLFGVPRIRRLDIDPVVELDWIFDTDKEVEEFVETIQRRRNERSTPQP